MSQLERVFGKFKTSKGSGAEGIANYYLKISLPVIAESFCEIFDLSVATGAFPDSWKIARMAQTDLSAAVSVQGFRKFDLQPTLLLP